MPGLGRVLLVFSAGWFLLFSILTITARALGTTQPPNLALAGFSEGCTERLQPCWNGIIPGITTMTDALRSLQERGYQIYEHFDPLVGHDDFLVVDTDNPLACGLTLIPLTDTTTSLRLACPDLRLGDVLAAFGVPDAFANPLLYYNSGMNLLPDSTLSAYSKIQMVYLNSSAISPDVGYRWIGFMSWWRYQQIKS